VYRCILATSNFILILGEREDYDEKKGDKKKRGENVTVKKKLPKLQRRFHWGNNFRAAKEKKKPHRMQPENRKSSLNPFRAMGTERVRARVLGRSLPCYARYWRDGACQRRGLNKKKNVKELIFAERLSRRIGVVRRGKNLLSRKKTRKKDSTRRRKDNKEEENRNHGPRKKNGRGSQHPFV